MDLFKISETLSKELNPFKNIEGFYISDPLEYAKEPYFNYLKKYGHAPKKAVFLGINPGPNGMAQTGIPFGDVYFVTNYLKITGKVCAPKTTHPKRPVNGFTHTKKEASGSRLWGYIQNKYPNAEDFFKDHFVLNYCPLVIFDLEGKNVTPDKLAKNIRSLIYAACDKALKETLAVLSPSTGVAVGKFALERFRQTAPNLKTVCIQHPSPANPLANKNWAANTDEILVKEKIF